MTVSRTTAPYAKRSGLLGYLKKKIDSFFAITDLMLDDLGARHLEPFMARDAPQ